jgi:hypothetical protein
MQAITGVPEEDRLAAWCKFDALAQGLRLDESAKAVLFGDAAPVTVKRPLRTRSGVSGGIDLQLSERLFVNAPILEPFAAESGLLLCVDDEQLTIKSDDGDLSLVVKPIPEPGFYSTRTATANRPMASVAQMCSPDRLCYGMTGPACSFWREDIRCQYCSIGTKVNPDALRKQEDELYETLEAALTEATWPARHVLLGGGTPSGPDMGAKLAARLCRGIKARFDLSVYAMIVAPLRDEFITELHAAGVDELGMNLEFWSDTAWRTYIPGKTERVGKRRYLAALEYAHSLFGPERTRSILIAGLEPAADTIAAVSTLASLGVMPILSPFRPLAGTILEGARGLSTGEYVALFETCKAVTEEAGVPLGPTCICCQNNTLSLPYGPWYRMYGEDVRDASR